MLPLLHSARFFGGSSLGIERTEAAGAYELRLGLCEDVDTVIAKRTLNMNVCRRASLLILHIANQETCLKSP